MIDTEILTNKECDCFLDLLRQNGELQFDNFEYNSIYRSSRDGLKEEIARNCYEKKPNILCLIEDENGIVLGGYTSTKWIRC